MIWFDLDDTVWDFTANSHTTLFELYADTPLLNGHFASAREWYEAYEAVNSELWRQYSRGEVDQTTLRSARFARPLCQAGVDPSLAWSVAPALDVEYLERLGTKRLLVEGAAQLLADLHGAGHRLGIVSNGFKGVQQCKLRSAGIIDMFDCIVLSDEVGINKPDRRFFDYALKCAGETDPLQNTIVGDNLQTDIEGALAAGWGRAVWLCRHRQEERPDNSAILIVHSLSEAKDYLMQ